jgi:hypothetical protein
VTSAGEAAVIAAAGVGAFKVATAGLSGLLAGGPLLVLTGALALFVASLENAREEIRLLQVDADEAATNGKEFIAYAKALAEAHKHAPPAATTKPEDSDAQKKFRQLTDEISQQTEKQKALNAVFGQSALTLQIVVIKQDELIKNKKIDVALSAAQHDAIVALNHQLAQQLILAAKLADAEQARARASKLELSNYQVEIGERIAATELKRAAAAKMTEEALAGVARQYERIRAIFAGHEALKAEADAEIAAQQKYKDDCIRSGRKAPDASRPTSSRA